MKKPNAQAELLSQPGELLRASRPRTDIFEQNYSADQGKLHATHLLNSIFFYLFIDYKHKHTATGLGCYGAHALNPIFFYF